MNSLVAAALLILSVCTPVLAGDLSNGDLKKHCANKTIVYNRKGIRIGERLDGFCAGYLQATLHALRNTPASVCNSTNDQTPEYLLSVYETYVKEKKVPASKGASMTLLQAFKQAFGCDPS